MTDKTSPRLWRTLGLGAALGLATGPAAALTPAAPEAGSDATLWQVQAESGEAGTEAPRTGTGEAGTETGEAGEAGEGGEAAAPEAGEAGEAGAAAPQGGESGEAGESGALSAENPAVAVLTGLALFEGHLRSGIEASQAGEAETSAIHFAHPAAELYEGLEPLLAAQGLPSLDPELDALEAAAPADQPAAAEAAIARIGELRSQVDATPAQRFEAMSAALRVAAQEYEVGVVDGAVANAEEYQDARGFVAAVRAEAEALAGSPEPEVASAANDVLAALAETGAALPAFAPDAPLPADAAQILYGAAARVELAGLALR